MCGHVASCALFIAPLCTLSIYTSVFYLSTVNIVRVYFGEETKAQRERRRQRRAPPRAPIYSMCVAARPRGRGAGATVVPCASLRATQPIHRLSTQHSAALYAVSTIGQ